MSEELRMEATMHLDHPLTEEQRDYLLDVDFDHTPAVYFRTKHGKEVLFVKAQPDNGWISVKDRLPGEWITVLTFQPTLSDGEGLIRTAVYIGTGKWREAERHELMELPVTHWMPLPEPPMGSDADD